MKVIPTREQNFKTNQYNTLTAYVFMTVLYVGTRRISMFCILRRFQIPFIRLSSTVAQITNLKMNLYLLQTASELSSGAICKLQIAKLQVLKQNQKRWNIDGIE